MNAQRELGSDVMMRLMHVQQGRGEKLTELIRKQLARLLKELREEMQQDQLIGELRREMQAEQEGNTIVSNDPEFRKMAVVGNTVMCHLFLGMDSSGLCGVPFQTAYQGSFHTRGSELGLMEYPEMEILVLPGIAAHVGADAAAVMGTQHLWQPDRIQLAIDLGTNAEILWNDYGRVYACSTAAGPAFEGAGIACGSMAAPGAVSALQMMRSNGNMIIDVIPDSEGGLLPPIGICGSGLIDSIAALRQCGLLQSDGRMLTQSEACSLGIPAGLAERVQKDSTGQLKFVIFDPERDKMNARESGDKKIYLTQEDIRAFQMAKAAIQAGIMVLCQETGRSLSEITECQIA